jgi:hypothetical protein
MLSDSTKRCRQVADFGALTAGTARLPSLIVENDLRRRFARFKLCAHFLRKKPAT